MYFLLPPSETKAPGGSVFADLPGLTFPELGAARKSVAASYGLENIDFQSSMSAIDRYTGTLYSAIHGRGLKGSVTANNSLDELQRQLAEGRVFVQSALFGLVGANDFIPSYKVNPAKKLNGLNLKTVWAQAHSSIWSRFSAGLVIDLRSKAYAELAPIPSEVDSLTVAVYVEKSDGTREQLNHFNKKAKGQLVRAVLTGAEIPGTLDELASRAEQAGLRIEVMDGTLTLVTRQAT